MSDNNIFSDIYNDFFGNKKKDHDNLWNKDFQINADFPVIEVKKDNNENVENTSISEEQKDAQMRTFFERIDEIQITDESKRILKKMLEYARKYADKQVNEYIPFNIRVYCDNNHTLYDITDVLRDGLTFFKYLPKDEALEASFILIDDESKVLEMYNSQNTIIVLKDIRELAKKDIQVKQKILSIWESAIIENEDKIFTIIVDKDKSSIDDALDTNPVLKDKIFSFEIMAKNMDIQGVNNKVIENLEKNYKLTDEFKVKLLDYISATFPKTKLAYPEYIDGLCEKIIFNSTGNNITENDIPEYEKGKSNEEIFEELNELVGLESVKEMLNDLVSLIEFKNKAKDKIKVKNTNLHMVFLGNPGTGKTTVARMVASILYNLKYIDQNKLIEVSAKDLIAEYVGQTGPRTMAVIEKAMGGVLFIDEAYSLASQSGDGNSFKEECIATLIQAMENYRDNLVVIFAGYSKEMQCFLNANSGIVSRIGYTLNFEDYTVEQLMSIFKSMFNKAGFELDKDAEEKAKNIFVEYKNTKNFGNARFARNLYEKTVIKHASNTKNKSSLKSLKTIKKEDISTENLLKM